MSEEVCISMELSIHLEKPITRFQASPMWEEWGGLNTQEQPSSPHRFGFYCTSLVLNDVCQGC